MKKPRLEEMLSEADSKSESPSSCYYPNHGGARLSRLIVVVGVFSKINRVSKVFSLIRLLLRLISVGSGEDEEVPRILLKSITVSKKTIRRRRSRRRRRRRAKMVNLGMMMRARVKKS